MISFAFGNKENYVWIPVDRGEPISFPLRRLGLSAFTIVFFALFFLGYLFYSTVFWLNSVQSSLMEDTNYDPLISC